jgi:hypothetical protein
VQDPCSQFALVNVKFSNPTPLRAIQFVSKFKHALTSIHGKMYTSLEEHVPQVWLQLVLHVDQPIFSLKKKGGWANIKASQPTRD